MSRVTGTPLIAHYWLSSAGNAGHKGRSHGRGTFWASRRDIVLRSERAPTHAD
jgi:hypothetical protein